MNTPLFQAAGQALTGNKSLRFPLDIRVCRHDFQTALTAAWATVLQMGELSQNWQPEHGKLIFAPDEPSVAASLVCHFAQDNDEAWLTLATTIELVFDFQANIWQRLAAVASMLDFLTDLSQQLSDETTQLMVKNTELY